MYKRSIRAGVGSKKADRWDVEGGREMKNVENGILSEQYEKLVIEDIATGKEIAVITDTEVTTATDTIVVKLTPSSF